MAARLGRAVTLIALFALMTAAGAAASSDGTFERTWGKDVIQGNPTDPEICIVAAMCQSGTSVINAGAVGGAFNLPADVATDAAGNVYVTDTQLDSVQKFDANGNFLRMWGFDVDPANPGAFGVCTNGPVCRSGQPSGVGGGLSGPSGIAVAPDGTVVVTEASNSRISEFAPDGTFIRTMGRWVDTTDGPMGFEVCGAAHALSCGQADASGPDGFSIPRGVEVDAAGNIYVADSQSRRVVELTLTGTFVRTWGRNVSPGPAGPGICTASWTACQNGSIGIQGGEFNLPYGLALGPGGAVYVVEGSNNRVSKFDATGHFQRAWGKDVAGTGNGMCTIAASCTAGSFGVQGGQFALPNNAAVDEDGNVYVTEDSGDRVQRFGPDGSFQRAWGKGVDSTQPGVVAACTVASQCTSGSGGGEGGAFNRTQGLDFGPDGALYVADFSGARITKYGAPPSRPSINGGSSTNSPANNNNPTVQGSAAPGSTVMIYDNPTCSGTPLATGTAAQFTGTGLTVPVPDDSRTEFYVAASDVNGTSPCSTVAVVYVEDSTAPDTFLDAGPFGTATAPTFLFHSSDAGATFQCRFDGAPFAPCSGPTGSHAPGGPLAAGPHTFEVRAVDAAGNADPTPAQSAFTVDATQSGPPPPSTRIITGPPSTSSSAPTFTFEASVPVVSFECRVDAGAFTRCTTPFTIYGLSLGAHTFYVRGVTAAGGRIAPATSLFKLETTTRQGVCDLSRVRGPSRTSCTLQPIDRCPPGSECTMTGSISFSAPDDRISTVATLAMDDVHSGHSDTTCESQPSVAPKPAYAKCPATTSLSYVATAADLTRSAPPLTATCVWDSTAERGGGTFAPFEKRSERCRADVVISPVSPLKVLVAGSTVSTVAPGPGTMIVSAPASGKGRAVAAAKPKKPKPVPPISTVKIGVKQPGIVKIPLKLSKAAKATLSRLRKLTLTLKVSFTPSGSRTATVRSQKVTITLPRCKPKQGTGLPRCSK